MPFVGFMVAAGGLLLLYGAIKGESPAKILEAILTGKAPSGTDFPLPHVDPAAGGGGGSVPGTAGDTPSENFSSVDLAGVSEQRSAVVKFCQSQEGKPYLWAAAGPDKYDCSGLTMMAYKSVGVNLPHYSVAQATMGTQVSDAQARPGDLVFYHPGGVHHVGCYIGNGQMINAPHSGTVVRVDQVVRSNEAHFIRSLLP